MLLLEKSKDGFSLHHATSSRDSRSAQGTGFPNKRYGGSIQFTINCEIQDSANEIDRSDGSMARGDSDKKQWNGGGWRDDAVERWCRKIWNWAETRLVDMA